jgi:hypothetical protein
MNLLRNLTLACLLALAPLSLTIGCKSPHTAQQLAIKSLETTWQSVHASRKVYAQLYKAGKVSAETHARALEADRQFRTCFDQALNASEQDWARVTPAAVAAAAESFINIVAAIAAN